MQEAYRGLEVINTDTDMLRCYSIAIVEAGRELGVANVVLKFENVLGQISEMEVEDFYNPELEQELYEMLSRSIPLVN